MNAITYRIASLAEDGHSCLPFPSKWKDLHSGYKTVIKCSVKASVSPLLWGADWITAGRAFNVFRLQCSCTHSKRLLASSCLHSLAWENDISFQQGCVCCCAWLSQIPRVFSEFSLQILAMRLPFSLVRHCNRWLSESQTQTGLSQLASNYILLFPAHFAMPAQVAMVDWRTREPWTE